jgi:hypothetical protein
MEIYIDGGRSSLEDWTRAQQWPIEQLPPLTPEQKTVAGKLGISEVDYARSAYAGELSRGELVSKTERFGRLVEGIMREMFPDASVEKVSLKTFAGRIQVQATAGGHPVHFDVDEDLVDGLLRSGSAQLEAGLRRIVELSLPAPGTVKAS